MRSGSLMSALTLGFLLATREGEACLCAWPSTPDQFNEARLVFRGRVEAVKPVRLPVRDEPGEVTATAVTFNSDFRRAVTVRPT